MSRDGSPALGEQGRLEIEAALGKEMAHVASRASATTGPQAAIGAARKFRAPPLRLNLVLPSILMILLAQIVWYAIS
jgi:hypothetical protein